MSKRILRLNLMKMDFVGDNNEVNPDNESDLIRF